MPSGLMSHVPVKHIYRLLCGISVCQCHDVEMYDVQLFIRYA